jgi:hypothetical protein
MTDINTNYNTLKNSNLSNYTNTNTTSIENIIQAINENLSELTLVQNEMNTSNNIDREILVKQDQLLRMKNDDLMNQLKELELIESNIANKDRIIEQTNNNIQNQNNYINNLIISIGLALILLKIVHLYSIGMLDNTKFIIILIIIILLYLVMYLYTYNIFYIKDAITLLINRRTLNSLENKVTTWATDIKNIAQTNNNNIQQNWINNNCSCPAPTVEENAEEISIYATDPNVSTKEIPGYFYYDGTAPAQLLVPTPDPVKLNLNETIDWVDYSSNGNVLYNPNTNKINYDNTYYYNYKNTNDPVLALQKQINEFNSNSNGISLVDSETYSTNF